jgi:EpsI family protein
MKASINRRSLVLLGAFGATSLMAAHLRPGPKVNRADSFKLDDLVPRQLPGWQATQPQAVAVNPQTQELLDSIYSQIVERTYVNPQGYAVMLAIAYGNDQRGSLEAHKPEVCYPAQGFKLIKQREVKLATPFGVIPAKYLETANGPRYEPVTYWFTMSSEIVDSQWSKRLNQLRQTLTGQIPDGLLFRVSSIDPDGAHALAMQQQFVNEMLGAVDPTLRKRLAGI